MNDKTEITVTIPAQSRFVALVRVTAASLAAELDFTVDEIADVRVGADELTALLIEWAEDHDRSTITLSYRLTEDCLELEGTAAAGPGAEPVGGMERQSLDNITEQILSAVVDGYAIEEGWGRIIKRRSGP